MDLVDPNDSKEHALQVVKFSVQNNENEALHAALDTHFKDSTLSEFPQECAQILYTSLTSQNHSVFQTLLKYIDDDFLNQKVGCESKTPLTKLLCTAVESDKAENIDVLVRRGADLNAFYQGRPLLHLALDLGYTDVALALINAGANLLALDRRGNGVLSSAITSPAKNKASLVRTLLEKGSNPVQKSGSGKLPLHIAATSNADVIDVLLETGYDINITDEVHGEAPLHFACSSCCKDTVVRLIQRGATFNLVNKRGETPLHKLLRFAVDYHDFHSKTRMEFARKLISIGFKMVPKKCDFKSSKRKGRDKVGDLYAFLKLSMPDVPALQSIARAELRETFHGTALEKKLELLDIPKHLKSYLLFHDTSFPL